MNTTCSCLRALMYCQKHLKSKPKPFDSDFNALWLSYPQMLTISFFRFAFSTFVQLKYANLQVTHDDQGTYTLVLNSSMFGKSNITFIIEIKNLSKSTSPMTIAVGCLSSVLILIVALAAILTGIEKRRQQEMKNSNINLVTTRSIF